MKNYYEMTFQELHKEIDFYVRETMRETGETNWGKAYFKTLVPEDLVKADLIETQRIAEKIKETLKRIPNRRAEYEDNKFNRAEFNNGRMEK